MNAITVPPPAEIAQRIIACREELAALRRLQKLAKAAQAAQQREQERLEQKAVASAN